MFGAATSAYQIEGAWNFGDKSESIWDRLLHTYPSIVFDKSNGDEACFSADFWTRDIEIAHELGLQMYRLVCSKQLSSEQVLLLSDLLSKITTTMSTKSFAQCRAKFNGERCYNKVEEFVTSISVFKKIEKISDDDALEGLSLVLTDKAATFSISWPRVLPTGFPNKISQYGKSYYSKLIDGLLKKGIQPVVTMYHWDLPQSLQDLGGWTNPLIATWFADYARVLYSLFGDRVKYWITINEPLTICDGGYNKMAAPFLNDMKISNYLCSKHVLLAHAKAFRIYDEEFRKAHRGKISLANIFFWFEPENAIKDTKATQLTMQLWEGRFGHPVYSKSGGWPPELEKHMAVLSAKEGYRQSRLPPFTPEEINLIKGTYDFYALNHYTTRLVRAVPPKVADPWPYYGSKELGVSFVNHPSRRTIVIDWFQVYPEGLRKQLHWIKDNYEVKDIMITENGLPSLRDSLTDYDRLDYIRENLKQVLLAINEGVNVMGYTVWSLIDSFEWITGYQYNPYRLRTARESALYYKSVIQNRTILNMD
ncbi:hypothetical protein HW555_003289 [Spodoptera exigua]|uniref:Beta-glucosidase n=1 Tax=Spodoptera exigua TaxID=7107 RepID=A0A835L6C1_SPOEX|nr:hypothetical protein HW555_003289 [Spodoptera exigua]